VRSEGDRNEGVSVECALIRAIVICGEIRNGCGVTSDLASDSKIIMCQWEGLRSI
jgi:hypothetical protein